MNVQRYLIKKNSLIDQQLQKNLHFFWTLFFPSFNSSCIISCIFIIIPPGGPNASDIIHWPKLHFPKSSPVHSGVGRGGLELELVEEASL